jgi:YegS/Rv2252/BmrU family lipid kinase
MCTTWYAIVNPTSRKCKSLKILNKLKLLCIQNNLDVVFNLTNYAHHEKLLVQNAIENGFTKIISVGGDGTLHHIVNGIMDQKIVNINKITLAVIPFGTGNDWIKTYNISTNINKAILIISNGKTVSQDIGRIEFTSTKKIHYFNNVAGIGFDAFTVHKISSLKLKRLGSAAYLLGGILSFFSFKAKQVNIDLNNKIFDLPLFMMNIGLCKYSGGGMQLTDFKNHKNGYFDITLIKNIKLIKILVNISKLFNGNLKSLNEVETFQSKQIKVKISEFTFIQADGEIIGNGNAEFSIIEKAIHFIVP